VLLIIKPEAMNVLTLILATLALTNKYISFVFKLFLSGVTGYWLFKLFDPSMYLFDIKEYNNKQIGEWISSGYAFYSICATGLSLLVFHWLIRILFINVIANPIFNYIHRFKNTIPNELIRRIKASSIVTLRNLIRKAKKRGIIWKTKENKRMTPDEHFESIISTFTISIHVIFCWYILKIYDKFPIYILFTAIILLLTISLIFSPLIKIMTFIVDTVEHESELIHKDLV
jgi:hypothetical protein